MVAYASISARVKEIRSMAHDFEKAHAAEIQLYQDVLAGIANGDYLFPDIAAAQALQVTTIKFIRVTS
jgi:hypothetical protein